MDSTLQSLRDADQAGGRHLFKRSARKILEREIATRLPA
jgi:hypothetical protein